MAKSLAYRLLGNPIYCTRRLFGGGYPHYGYFLRFWGIAGSARLVSQRMQPSRENGTPPFVGHLRGPREGVFRTPCVSSGQLEWRASEGGGGIPPPSPAVRNYTLEPPVAQMHPREGL